MGKGGCGVFVLATVVAGWFGGCVGDSESLPGTAGQPCTVTTDCLPGLVCIHQVCRSAQEYCPIHSNCEGLTCGPDPVCGEPCGTCEQDETCEAGRCVLPGWQDAYSPDPGATWTDPSSGLTWPVFPATEWMTWPEANTYCAASNLDGNNWRLPTIGELRTLIRGCPATQPDGTCNIDEHHCLAWACKERSCMGCLSAHAPNDGCYWPRTMLGYCSAYWSSSFHEGEEERVWRVLFGKGGVVLNDVTSIGRVRCVR